MQIGFSHPMNAQSLENRKNFYGHQEGAFFFVFQFCEVAGLVIHKSF
jgi:hypothetical protein